MPKCGPTQAYANYNSARSYVSDVLLLGIRCLPLPLPLLGIRYVLHVSP